MGVEMVDTEFELRAIVTALATSAAIYRIVAENAAQDDLRDVFNETAAERDELAKALAEPLGETLELAGPEEFGLEDPARTTKLGMGTLIEMVARIEARIEEALEDAQQGLLPEPVLNQTLASIASMKSRLDEAMRDAAAGAREYGLESLGAEKEVNVYRVGYATNREPKIKNGKLVGYTGQRDDPNVHYGFCDVTIPENHKIGSTGSPWWKRIFTGDDRLTYEAPESAEREDVLAWMRSRMEDNGRKEAMVFIHGYNVSFRDAALQSAQIGADLNFEGAMSFFSWPSRGRLLGYFYDAATIGAAEGAIARYLVDVAENSGAERVHVIAHSMGNRGLLRAMTKIISDASQASGRKFDQIILAAPDVDATTFKELASAYHTLANRTTLYVSREDWAVRASRLVNGGNRVGFTPPVTVLDNIDTISVEHVDLTLLGHGYVSGSVDVLGDIHDVIAGGDGPDNRFRLKPKQNEGGKTYWTFNR